LTEITKILDVELLERLSVLILQLIFNYYLIRHDLNLLHGLREEIPDVASVREPVSVRQGGGELRGAEAKRKGKLTLSISCWQEPLRRRRWAKKSR
jgi:hypothetical protein